MSTDEQSARIRELVELSDQGFVSRASTKHTSGVSKVSENVRPSVQRKCHSVMPRWYQMMA